MLYRLAEPADWQHAQQTGFFISADLAAEGFIHSSEQHQVLETARRYYAGRLSLDVQHDLRRRVFDAVTRLDGERQDALRTGQVASRAITDLQLLQGLLSMVPFTLGTASLVVTSIAAML